MAHLQRFSGCRTPNSHSRGASPSESCSVLAAHHSIAAALVLSSPQAVHTNYVRQLHKCRQQTTQNEEQPARQELGEQHATPALSTMTYQTKEYRHDDTMNHDIPMPPTNCMMIWNPLTWSHSSVTNCTAAQPAHRRTLSLNIVKPPIKPTKLTASIITDTTSTPCMAAGVLEPPHAKKSITLHARSAPDRQRLCQFGMRCFQATRRCWHSVQPHVIHVKPCRAQYSSATCRTLWNNAISVTTK